MDTPRTTFYSNIGQVVLGTGLAFLIALGAQTVGKAYPEIGAPILAIVFGIALTFVIDKRFLKTLEPGLRFASKTLLQISIVLLGANLDMYELIVIGHQSLPVLLGTLFIALSTGFLLGKVARIPWKLATLITVGTAICGASAIAAVAPVVAASTGEVAYSISTVFLYNMMALVIFPAVGKLVQMNELAFGLWSGTAINDTSSVVAVAFSYSETAGKFATAVKLARSTMILPIVLVLALYMVWKQPTIAEPETAATRERPLYWKNAFPWFILYFLVASITYSVGIIPEFLANNLSSAGRFLMVVALAAVGLSSNFGQLRSTGFSPLLLGFVVWLVTAVSSLVIQWITTPGLQ